MTSTTAGRAAEMAGCSLIYGSGENAFTAVERDSGLVDEDHMFAGIVGRSNDGNRFAGPAYDRGCRVFLLSSKQEADSLHSAHSDADILLADDTVRALQQLAGSYIAEKKRLIKVAVTGSTGKTTTKELLSRIFAVKYRTVSNFGNYNNEIGLPLTVFRVEDDTEAGIFEMGMEAPGEIELLAGIVRPETAAITNIGISHMERLGSRENILKAKMEITSYMDGDSLLAVNCDNDLLGALRDDGPYRLLRAGETAGEYGAGNIVISDVCDKGMNGVSFKLTSGDETADFSLSMPGVHNAWNASLAVACGMRYGISMADAAEALRTAENTGNRLKITKTDRITVIDDTYNASPDSMRAALDVLRSSDSGRRVAVLGDMLELGDHTDEHHREIGAYAADRADVLLTVGEKGALIAEGARRAGGACAMAEHFMSVDDLLSGIAGLLQPGDTVLVKASNGMRLSGVSEFLLKEL